MRDGVGELVLARCLAEQTAEARGYTANWPTLLAVSLHWSTESRTISLILPTVRPPRCPATRAQLTVGPTKPQAVLEDGDGMTRSLFAIASARSQ